MSEAEKNTSQEAEKSFLAKLYESLIKETKQNLNQEKKEINSSAFAVSESIKEMKFPSIIQALENNLLLHKEIDETETFTTYKTKDGKDIFSFAQNGKWYETWEYDKKNELITNRYSYFEIGEDIEVVSDKEDEKNVQYDTKRTRIDYQNGIKSKITEERFIYKDNKEVFHITPFWIIKEYKFDRKNNEVPNKISKKGLNQDPITGARMGFEGEVNRGVKLSKDRKIIMGAGSIKEAKMFEESFAKQSDEFNQNCEKDDSIIIPKKYFDKILRFLSPEANVKWEKYEEFKKSAFDATGFDSNGNKYIYAQDEYQNVDFSVRDLNGNILRWVKFNSESVDDSGKVVEYWSLDENYQIDENGLLEGFTSKYYKTDKKGIGETLVNIRYIFDFEGNIANIKYDLSNDDNNDSEFAGNMNFSFDLLKKDDGYYYGGKKVDLGYKNPKENLELTILASAIKQFESKNKSYKSGKILNKKTEDSENTI